MVFHLQYYQAYIARIIYTFIRKVNFLLAYIFQHTLYANQSVQKNVSIKTAYLCYNYLIIAVHLLQFFINIQYCMS